MPGNGTQSGPRRDTVGSEVSDDDSKMVICEEGTADVQTDTTPIKTGKYLVLWYRLQLSQVQ